MDYNKAVSYLEALPTPEKWDLAIPRELSKRAAIKYDYEVIQVAGTNGKGSVCAFLSSILSAQGYSVGLYASPHLQKYNERLQINGKAISDAAFVRIIYDLRSHIERLRKEGRCPSFFEALTVAAFKYFGRMKIDFLILEAGMGGRLDATNIAPSKFQAISTISRDHMRNLGNSLEKIASEKAGIIKPGSSVSTSCKSAAALKKIEGKCDETGSELSVLGRDFNCKSIRESIRGGKFNFMGRNLRLDNLEIRLLGAHQVENASVALSVVENMLEKGIPISENAIRRGLKNAKWPGRLEIISKQPTILLDGAHNVEGIRSLKRFLEEIFLKSGGRKLILVMAIMADKEYAKMIEEVAPIAGEFIFTKASLYRSATPEMLQKAALSPRIRKKIPITTKNSLPDAIEYAKSIASDKDIICITGSLYAIGEARAYLLRNRR
ncbi:MAG: folylpolyglutamate synthase/dihydrofolate synthase family protein [Candidatus Micrarchaeota archaeon]